MTDSCGFCFDFDGAEPAVRHDGGDDESSAVCGASAGDATPRTARVAVSSFAWHTLTPDVLARWLARYPRATATTSSPTTTMATRAMQLRLPLRDTPAEACSAHNNNNNNSDDTVTVYYQSAAELVDLCTPAGRDVVPGSYYGSLKVWSCAPRLASYLVTHADVWRPRLRRASVVAELGCGQGVVGLTALCLGARRVLFYDYNAEVLECCVQPNLAATLAHASTSAAAAARMPHVEAVQLVHGDWADLHYDNDNDSGNDNDTDSNDSDDEDNNSDSKTCRRRCARGCDVILGSDVTFDATACAKLADVLQRWLCPHHGVALIATKVYYFGTHGGSDVFARHAAQRGLRVCEVARVHEERAMWQVILHVSKPRDCHDAAAAV